MKKWLVFILVGIILFPAMVLATSPIMEYKDLDKNMTRKELATIGVRIKELENLVKFYEKKNYFKDVEGWAKPYINLAYSFDIMKGTGKGKFMPDDNITYVELLTVIMRGLGYEDGIDFQIYPEDYYNKALEIGLADLYIPHNQVITRGIAYDTLSKVYDMDYKNTPNQTSEDYPIVEMDEIDIDFIDTFRVKNLSFNTSIVGVFSGKLVGPEDFSGYKVELWTRDGRFLKEASLDKQGKFRVSNFDIDLSTRLKGYMYSIYDNHGWLVWEDYLE